MTGERPTKLGEAERWLLYRLENEIDMIRGALARHEDEIPPGEVEWLLHYVEKCEWFHREIGAGRVGTMDIPRSGNFYDCLLIELSKHGAN